MLFHQAVSTLPLFENAKVAQMQKHVRQFVEIAARTLPLIEPIYEFGSMQVQNGDSEADLRSIFRGRSYVGSDFRSGPGVDKVLNLHDIQEMDGSIGTVICVDTLEHVEYPRRAMQELYRVLQNDGVAIISSVMNFPIHGYPNDYWRFTPEGFRSLLNVFDGHFVGSCGSDPSFPQTIVGIGFKTKTPDIEAFHAEYAKWELRNNNLMKFLQEQEQGAL